jgi:predicted DNA-binding transcriptional regulator YafY
MRHDKAAKLVRMAMLLTSARPGYTLDELCEKLEVKRRTMERMRDALASVFPTLDHIDGEDGKRRFFLPPAKAFTYLPTADELSELALAIKGLRTSHQNDRAEVLETLVARLSQAIDGAGRSRIETDLEALLGAETVVAPVGPGPRNDPDQLKTLRYAIKAGSCVRFRYEPNVRTRKTLTVAPLGLLLGRRTQLVGLAPNGGNPEQYRLDRMFDVEAVDVIATRPDDFNLEVYARQSFGLAHDDVEDVILRFNIKAAPDARNWRFHTSQIIADLPDGRVEIRMRCSGMLELVHHLFSWGPNMEIVSPDRLIRIMRGELVRALDQHAPRSVKERARELFAPPGTTWESYGGGAGQP